MPAPVPKTRPLHRTRQAAGRARGAVLAGLSRLLSVWLLSASPTLADGIRLHRGVSMPIWETWPDVAQIIATPGLRAPFPEWRSVLSGDSVRHLHDQGFDFIRLPIDPAPFLALGPGPARRAMIDQTLQTIALIHSTGLSVVVDLHAFPRPGERWGTADIVNTLWPQHLALVAEIAAALNGLPPDRTALEPLNEPTHDCDSVYSDAPPVWPEQLAQMHSAARAAAPDLTLVLSGACWGGVDGLISLDPALVDDSNVLWSFHSYDPFSFSHQGASWMAPPLKYLSGLPYPPALLTPEVAAGVRAAAIARMTATEGHADRAAIEDIVQTYAEQDRATTGRDIFRAAAWADAHGLAHDRLLLGEFGALAGEGDPPAWRSSFLADKRQAAEALGIAWAVWTLTGSMGVSTDPTARALAPGICAALGLQGCPP